jgi:hypothetical protein
MFRDCGAATRVTLAELLERYAREVCPTHKGAESWICRLDRMILDESFVHKRLAETSTEDLVNDRLTGVAPSIGTSPDVAEQSRPGAWR